MDEELLVGARPLWVPSSVQTGARRGQLKVRELERRRSGEEILVSATPGWGWVGGQRRIVPVPGKDGDEVRAVTLSAIRR